MLSQIVWSALWQLSQRCQGIGLRIEDVVLVLPRPPLQERTTTTTDTDLEATERVTFTSTRDHANSREAYLDALLDEWKKRHVQEDENHPLVQTLKEHFVLAQRRALFGDEALCNRQFEEERSYALSWYPFDVVVMTATVPKDVSDVLDAVHAHASVTS